MLLRLLSLVDVRVRVGVVPGLHLLVRIGVARFKVPLRAAGYLGSRASIIDTAWKEWKDKVAEYPIRIS